MAIFGDLAHHTFTDVAKVIRQQSGTLFLHRAYQGQTVEMLLSNDVLQAVFIDGFPVMQPVKIRDVLFYLVTHNEGRYEFEEQQVRVDQPLNLLLSDIMRQVAADATVQEDQLPHAETRFVADTYVGNVPASLQEKWSRIQPLLGAGVSAVDLSQKLPYSQQEMRVALHQLRAVGLIAPQRAMGERNFGASAPQQHSQPAGQATGRSAAPAAENAAPRSLVKNLLGSLRRLMGGSR